MKFIRLFWCSFTILALIVGFVASMVTLIPMIVSPQLTRSMNAETSINSGIRNLQKNVKTQPDEIHAILYALGLTSSVFLPLWCILKLLDKYKLQNKHYQHYTFFD